MRLSTATPAVVADLARWPGKGPFRRGVSHMAEQPEAQETRSAYLLDGRRVTIADLIGAGLIAPGDALRFKRPRVGQTHKATVTSDSTLALEGGQEFRSPSKAAQVAADMSAVDGWHAWTMASSGRSLDSLRQELLDQVAAGTSGQAVTPDSGAPSLQDRYEWLKEARVRADVKKPVGLSVRDLLARWDAKARGARVNQRIEADLANHGLATSPSFRKVTIDARVHLITASQDAEATGNAPADGDDGNELDVGLTVLRR
jgi:hypothetical protein